MNKISDRLKTRLPSLDPASNPAWRNLLAIRELVQNNFRTLGHLSHSTFESILDWKLRQQRNRTEIHRACLTADIIMKTTTCFDQVKHEDEKIERDIRLNVLCALPGVGMGVATAILALAHPKDYGIIDFRAWNVLYGTEKRIFTVSDYDRYLADLRKIRAILGCDAQEVDFLLWDAYANP